MKKENLIIGNSVSKNLPDGIVINENDYRKLFHQTVEIIERSRVQVAKQINSTRTSTYWEIGKLLTELKIDSKHGDGIVNRLSVDLKKLYPNMGLSPRNLWDMKRFYLIYYQEDKKLRQAVAVLPWGHNLVLMNNNISSESIIFYSNEVFRSTYNIGFIDATEPLKELDLEKRLVNKITSFIMELGRGFSFIGNQYTLSYNNKEYRVDLLFYNRQLESMVAIELKIGEFKPEYVGKMNFYLSLLDKLEKLPHEKPSIGIILCASKEHLEVEMALQDVNKPISVAEYKYLFPKDKLQNILIDELKK